MDEALIQDIDEGSQFMLAENIYIKTNMIHRETGNRYCCHLLTGVMYIFPEDTEVELISQHTSKIS